VNFCPGRNSRGGENLRGVGKIGCLSRSSTMRVLDVEKREEANAHQHYAADGCQQAHTIRDLR